MHAAMKCSTALAVAAALAAVTVPAQADKPELKAEKAAASRGPDGAQANKASDSGKPAAPARAENPGPANQPGAANRDAPKDKTPERGKSAEAHAAAPGQNGTAPGLSGDAPGRNGEAKLPGAVGDDKSNDNGRAERRRTRRAELKDRYGMELLAQASVRDELRVHAMRVARLERMRTLAGTLDDAAKRKKMLDRLEKLAAKEDARFDKHMAELKNAPVAKPENGKPDAAGKPENKSAQNDKEGAR